MPCLAVIASSLRAAVSGLPPVFWYVWGGTLVNRLGSFVAPFLALYLTEERHLTPAQAGAVVALWGLGALGAAPTGGLLADRVGRKATLLAGLVLSALGMLGLGLAHDVRLVAPLTLVLGFCTELYRPAVFALVADVVPEASRLRAYAALYWAANLGFSIAPVVAGLLAGRSFLALFVADAATTLLYALAVWRKVPETRPAEARGAGGAGPGPARLLWQRLGFAEVARDGVFLTFVGLTMGMGLLFFQHNSTLPMDMRAHGVSARHFGLVLALNGVLIVLLQPLAARTLRSLRRSHVLAASALLTGAGFGLNAWAHSVPHYALGVAVWTLGEIAHAPVSSALVADLAPPAARGRYQGVFFMSFGVGSFVAPALGGWVLHTVGGGVLWGACFALGVVLALAHLLVAAPRRRRLAQLHAAGLSPATGAQE